MGLLNTLQLGHSGPDHDGSWRDAMDAMCDEGEAYCWMGCRALPRACPSPDLATCFSQKNNLTCSTEPNGKPMDPACKWECNPENDNDRAAYKVRALAKFLSSAIFWLSYS